MSQVFLPSRHFYVAFSDMYIVCAGTKRVGQTVTIKVIKDRDRTPHVGNF